MLTPVIGNFVEKLRNLPSTKIVGEFVKVL